MRKAQIVVGMGYGDEGKGITTDFLCSQASNPIVIRYSGGQQAGHTVIHEGVKHIHSNFGSGTLRGIPTYFTEHTTFYPATIVREGKRLNEKGIVPPLLVLHPLAKMTTPWDVFANRKDLNNLIDGTCGLGIGKTMKRNEENYQLRAIDSLCMETFKAKLASIGKNYYGYSLEDLNEAESQEMNDFLEAVSLLPWIVEDYSYLMIYDTLIFEGSQGILLDKDFGVFPHVTYANTSSKNAHEVCDKLGLTIRELYYVTRSYHTRHGAGPFKEQPITLINNEEEINVMNDYQGPFRKSPLNYDLLNHGIRIDKLFSNRTVTNLVITCVDQLPDFEIDSKQLDLNQFDKMYLSMSPDSKDFKEHFYFK